VVRVYEIPCSEAEAFKKIRQVDVVRVTGGIVMLDPVLAEVGAMNLSGEKDIGDELLKMMKIYNYIPARAEEQYRTALVREYRNSREWGV